MWYNLCIFSIISEEKDCIIDLFFYSFGNLIKLILVENVWFKKEEYVKWRLWWERWNVFVVVINFKKR